MRDEARSSIAVVIPMYDNARDIERCVASVLEQTRRPDRVVLIDDCCTDDTATLAATALDSDGMDYVVIGHEHNRGTGAARNSGLDIVTEDLVWFLDADDYAADTFLEVLAGALGNASFSQCRTLRVSGDGVALGVDEPAFGRDRVSGTEHVRMLLTGRARSYAPTKLFRRSLLGTAPWDEGRCYEDVVPVMRMSLASASVALVDAPLYRYCTRPGSTSTTFGMPTFDLFDVATDVSELLADVPRTAIGESERLQFEVHEIVVPLAHMAMRARHERGTDETTSTLASEAIGRARARVRPASVYALVRAGRWRDGAVVTMLRLFPGIYSFVLRFR